MTGAPPPYPQSPKAARRAQKQAWRSQQQQWRIWRRPSLVRPLVLIGIGVVALLVETGKISGFAFWTWYVRWWPVLLIGVGVLSLGEWWLDRDRPLAARSGVGGVVGILVVLAVLGWVGGWAGRGIGENGHRWGWHFGEGNDWDWGMHFFGQQHDRDEQLDEAMPANGMLVVRNPHGDVLLSTSTDGRIHITAHNVVYASNGHEAERYLGKLFPQLKVTGTQATLTVAELDRGSSDLTIQLPASSGVTVNAGHGDVSVDGLGGIVEVTADRGDVKLSTLANNATAHMSKGDFSARGIGGTLVLNGRVDDASITDVHDRVTLDGDFFGDLNLSALNAPVSFHSSRSTFEVQHLNDVLSLDSGDLRIGGAAGPIRITTRAKNLELSDITGPVTVENGDGDVSLGMAKAASDVEIGNRNGDIQLTLPPAASFDILATAGSGTVSSDFTPGTNAKHAGNSLSGQVGAGGPNIKLTTDHGDIQISKGDRAAIPVPPLPPSPPQPPEKLRHLRVPKSGAVEPTTQ